MFKNVRNYLVRRGELEDSLAPSYFLECLLYNVPDAAFGTSWVNTYRAVLQRLWTTPLSGYVCQNGVDSLFGPSAVQWNQQAALQLLTALVAQLN
jgi:hypothetical protein